MNDSLRRFQHWTLLWVIAALLGMLEPVAPAWATGAHASLADGAYLMDVTLEGGTGRATVTSPARVEVAGGEATATLVWSSPNYDYMVVDETRYLPVNEGGNSTFEIPVLAFDQPFEVIGDTTAMSVPHEVTYLLTFDAASAQTVHEGSRMPAVAVVATGAAAVGIVLLLRHR